MTPIREPERLLDLRLTARQCEAIRHSVARDVQRSAEAEADHDLLVQSVGELSRAEKDEADRLVHEAAVKRLRGP
jgi:hypothetical protein